MFLQKLGEMVGKFVVVTTLANNRVQGKILEVGPDYLAVAQEGAPKVRLIPAHSIDNVDMDMPARPAQGGSVQGGASGGPQKPQQPQQPPKGGILRR